MGGVAVAGVHVEVWRRLEHSRQRHHFDVFVYLSVRRFWGEVVESVQLGQTPSATMNQSLVALRSGCYADLQWTLT